MSEETVVPHTENKEQAVITPQEWFKTEFGDVDPTVVKERFTDYDNVKSQLSQREQLLQEKEAALANAYPDDFTKKLAELKKAGARSETIDAFWEVNKKPHSELTPKEQVVLQLKLEKGWSTKDAETYVNGIYSVDESDYLVDDYDTGEKVLSPKSQRAKELKELELKDKASAASDFLKQYTSKHFDPTAEIEARKQQELGYLSEVDKQFTNYAFQGLTGVEVLPADEKSGRESLVLDLDNGEFSKAAPQIAKDFLINNKLAPTAENLSKAGDFAKSVFFMQNGETLLKKGVDTAYNKGFEDAVKQFENPGRVKKDATGGTGAKDPRQAAFAKFVQSKAPKVTQR